MKRSWLKIDTVRLTSALARYYETPALRERAVIAGFERFQLTNEGYDKELEALLVRWATSELLRNGRITTVG